MSSAVDAPTEQDTGDDPGDETFDTQDVTAVRGRFGEPGSVDVELEDGRVVTALIDMVRSGEHECPNEECIRRFDTEHALNVHFGRVHASDQERVCEVCGDGFRASPSETTKYCSWDCYKQSRTDTAICGTCGAEFEHRSSHEPTYCSNPCRYEGMRATERPTDVEDLLYELYVEDGFDRETTLDRALAVLGVDSSHSRQSLNATLMSEVASDPFADLDIPDRLTADAVREFAEDAEAVVEVAREFRVSYDVIRRALARVGCLGPLQDQRPDVFEQARKNLGIDEEGNVVDTPESDAETDWSQFSARGGDSVDE